MNRFVRKTASGQSLPLIALIIVVLFGMVGLSVDVGNTYAQQRAIVSSTNSAALSAMNVVVRGGNDQAVAEAIRKSYESNGIQVVDDPTVALGPGQRRIYAYYLKGDGNPVAACTVGNCGSTNGGMVPQGVTYIQIRAEGQVDTYFARVVGQNNLPVSTQAFAAKCVPTEGVYPIGIRAEDLDVNGFRPPTTEQQRQFYGTYRDENYPSGRTQRRIYLKDNADIPGSFSYLRWKPEKNAANAVELANMLRGGGNLAQGFQEVTPWPDPNTAATSGYPHEPNQLSLGDWVHGNPGLSNSNAVNTELDKHIKDRTVMILPIGRFVGRGNSDSAFHVQRLGAFYLRDYGKQTGPDGGWYMDMVYLGDANTSACLRTNLEVTNNLGIVGEVWVNPRWRKPVPPRQPIFYQFVLDVTGSMSWNFQGEGTSGGTRTFMGNTTGGTDWQCESGHEATQRFRINTECQGGPRDPWRIASERRIYVAKHAVYNFIDQMGPNDGMQVVAFSTSQRNARILPASYVDPKLANAKALMKKAVEDAGRVSAAGNDPYRTEGGTPTAQAIQLANQQLSGNAIPKNAPNGQPYRRVMIILTDGVANYFLDGTSNTARDICSHLTPNQALNTAVPCQVGTTASGVLRPVTAMVHQTNLLKERHDASVFVVAVGGVQEVGFDLMASQPDWAYTARTPEVVGQILNVIRKKVENETCIPDGGYKWMDRVGSAHEPTPPVGTGIYGYVELRTQDGTPLPKGKDRLPIIHDPVSGKLSYSIPLNPSDAQSGLAPGIYQMTAHVMYKGNDGITQKYQWMIDPVNLSGSYSTSFQLSASGTLGRVVPLKPIFLDLDPDTLVCPR